MDLFRKTVQAVWPFDDTAAMTIYPAYLFALVGIAFGLFRALEHGRESVLAAAILPAGLAVSQVFR